MEKVRGPTTGRSSWTRARSRTSSMTGDAFTAWLDAPNEQHHELMAEAGFLAK